VLEGTLRQEAWVNGSFADGVILGQLASEWPPAGPSSAPADTESSAGGQEERLTA
jgi:hypothetical protein